MNSIDSLQTLQLLPDLGSVDIKSTIPSKRIWDDTEEDTEVPVEQDKKRRRQDDNGDEPAIRNVHIAQQLPYEVLQQLFECARNSERQIWLNYGHSIIDQRRYSFQESEIKDKAELWRHRVSSMECIRQEQHVLLDLSLVCRRWNIVATEMLYEEVQIQKCNSCISTNLWHAWADCSVDRRLEKGVAISPRARHEPILFLQSLRSSPHLGYLVRPAALIGGSGIETPYFFQILTNCPLIEDLKLYGYEPHSALLQTLGQLRHLRFLSIARAVRNRTPWDFTEVEDSWLKLLQSLPDIQYAMLPLSTSPPLVVYSKRRGITLKFQYDLISFRGPVSIM